MKRNFRIVLIAAFLATAPLFMLAQAPPHPNGGAAPGSGNGPVGGGAPIGGGVVYTGSNGSSLWRKETLLYARYIFSYRIALEKSYWLLAFGRWPWHLQLMPEY